MKIAFFSNFLNHHQLPLCQSLASAAGVEFTFVACERIPEDRIKMGYEDMNTKYPFVLRAYEDPAAAEEIARSADAVIFGACPTSYLALRMQENKLSFRFCERSLKKGTWRRFIPHTRRKIREGYTKYKKKNLYILGASSYAASDLALCGFDKKKCFEWGYFPAVEEKDLDAVFAKKRENKVPEILYAGRLLPLKHVMDTVRAVHHLKKQGVASHFTVVGEGESAGEIRAYIEANDLSDTVTLLPFMSPAEVRARMDGADIFVFGSDVGSYAEACLSLQCATQFLQHLHITIRCLNEYLCLMFAIDAFFELFESGRAVGFLDRQIALESERLSVETTSHERHQYARWTNQWHYLDTSTLRYSHYVCARIGNGRTTCF